MYSLSISSEDKERLEWIRTFLKEHLCESTFNSLEFDLTKTLHYPIVNPEDVVKPLSSDYMIGNLVVLKDNPHGPVYKIVDLTQFPAQVGLCYMGCETRKRTNTYANPRMLVPVDIGRPKYSFGGWARLNGVARLIKDMRIIWHNGYGRFVYQYELDGYPEIWWAERELDYNE